MKYSKLFGKTQKGIKEFDSKGVTYLFKAGYIDQTMSGVYSYLPLGWRVVRKIEEIVREEMDKIGQEIFMPALSPLDLWKQTDRFEKIDVLLKAIGANEISKEKNDTEYVLNPTHEEIVTPLAKKYISSYKEFPFSVYQLQTKFRNELRPKTGILRTREFRMKDMYSFHTSKEDMEKYYDVVKQAYMNIFNKLGIGDETYYAAASGGDFTEDFSHEFQTKCGSGEDLIFHVKSKNISFNREVAPSIAQTYEQDSNLKPIEEIFGENIVGVDDLCKFMNIPAHKTTKTLIYETEKGPIIASVRGDYEVNEIKLMKIAGVKSIKFASAELIKQLTGSEIGYAGIYNAPKDVPIYIDESAEKLVNFETGANKTNIHAANVNWDRDVKRPDKYYDIKLAKEGDLYPETNEEYEVFKASEVGNIFPLNTKFTESFNYSFIDVDGSQKPIYMGCYGLGTTRVMGVIAEKFSDEKGIIWPENIAPFKVHLIHLGKENREMADDLYNSLIQKGVEVLWDDRDDVMAGEKFNDADLIGIPYRVVISKKSLEQGGVEIKKRNDNNISIVNIDKISF